MGFGGRCGGVDATSESKRSLFEHANFKACDSVRSSPSKVGVLLIVSEVERGANDAAKRA